MKNQKGFTLVELLAVIVILAVVILIAVTAVIPRMNDARKGAFADEAMEYIKGAQEAYVESQMEGASGTTCFTVAWLNKYKIDKKESGYTGFVEISTEAATEGQGTAYIKNSKYMVDGESGTISKSDVAAVASSFSKSQPSGCQDVSA